jgi:hypothetical protein
MNKTQHLLTEALMRIDRGIPSSTGEWFSWRKHWKVLSLLLIQFGESKIQHIESIFLRCPWQTQNKIVRFYIPVQYPCMMHNLYSVKLFQTNESLSCWYLQFNQSIWGQWEEKTSSRYFWIIMINSDPEAPLRERFGFLLDHTSNTLVFLL